MIYYELSKAVADQYYDGVRYWVSETDITVKSWVAAMQRAHAGNQGRLLQHAERAWKDDDDGIRFIKNRRTGLMTPIDKREFFLVKLQARSVKVSK